MASRLRSSFTLQESDGRLRDCGRIALRREGSTWRAIARSDSRLLIGYRRRGSSRRRI
jgi:hypothetical protein